MVKPSTRGLIGPSLGGLPITGAIKNHEIAIDGGAQMKLDRLLAKHQSMGRTRARLEITHGRIRVDGRVETQISCEVDRFSRVEMDGRVIQPGERRLLIMLHKPSGVVSATRDPEHMTVIDLIDDPDRDSLHLVGRLDRNTTGLLLLTNDGRWSKALMHPDHKVPKVYWVETRDVIPADAVERFAAGFHFHTENLTTLPAQLEILSDRQARLTLHEGRYHQIKRMFHRMGNQVTALHRERIGALTLPDDLAPGEWRFLTDAGLIAPSLVGVNPVRQAKTGFSIESGSGQSSGLDEACHCR